MPSFSPRSRRFVVSLVIAGSIIAAVLFGVVTRAEFDPGAIFLPTLTATKSDTSLSGDGDGKADPGEVIGYTVVVSNTGADPATGVTFSDTIDAKTTLNAASLATSAVAVNDTFPVTVVGNVSIDSAAISGGPFSVLTNDYLGTNPAATITSFSATSANGGNVVLNLSTGTFTYDPPAGFEGTDTFTYVLTDNANATSAVANRTGTVSITVSGMVWFIDNGASSCVASGCGRLSNPYSTLAAFNTLNNGAGNNPAAGDSIFIYERASAYTGGITLLDNQRLIGQDAQASLSAITGLTPPVGSPAFPAMNLGGQTVDITNTTGNAITLANGNLVRGLQVTDASSSGIAGSATTNTAIIAGNNDVTITGVDGTAVGNGALSFNGGNGNITFSGTITGNNGDAVNIRNRTGGIVTIQGPVTSTTRGVVLTSNTGATIVFTGGMSLSTGANAAFTATGGGTVNATQNNSSIINTLATTTATALNIQNTTIGASDVTFRSIASNGGSATGIILINSGSTGSLSVTGTGGTTKGGDGTGGTITNKTGGTDGDGTTASAVYINNGSATLRNMIFTRLDNFGLYGLSVNSVRLQYSQVGAISGAACADADGDIGSSSGAQDAAIVFGKSNPGGLNGFNNGGSFLLDNLLVRCSIEHQVEIYAQSNTFSGTISNSDIKDNSTSFGSDGIQIETQGTANATISINGNAFDDNKSQPTQGAANDSSSLDITINSNTVTRSSQGNEGFVLSNGSNGDLTAHVTNNNISGIGGVAIFVGQTPGNATAASQLTAVISGNTINHPTTATNHALIFYPTSTVGQVSSANVLIQNNNITENGINGVSRPIEVNTPDASTSPAFTVSVISNTMSIGDNVTGAGSQVAARQSSAGCFDIRSNTVTFPNGTPAGIFGIRARQAGAATANLEQGVSAGTAATVLAANNAASTTEVLGTINVVGNSTCQNAPTIAPPAEVAVAQDSTDKESIDKHNALVAELEALNAPLLATGEAIVGENETSVLESIGNFANRIFSFIMPTASAQEARVSNGAKVRAPESGETVNVGPIGTLPSGKSVTIAFSVTVDALGVGEIRTRILNQGSADSNETAPVNTTDPAASADPACTAAPSIGTATCTPVDRPDTTITSINRVGSTPTNAASVSWTATFGTQIAGLTASNFSLLNTAGPCSSPSITSVTPVGPSPATSWTIAANTGAGSCTLGLNLANDGGLSHDITTALPFVGQTIVIDKIAPSTTSFVRFNPATSPTNADTLVFQATFSENVTGVDPADFAVTGTTATVTGVFGVGGGPDFSVYNVTVSGGDLAGLNGTVGLNFSGAMNITDIATNALPNTEPGTDQTYVLDNTAPTVDIVDVTPDPRNTAVASITITFSESVTGFDLADLSLTRDAAPVSLVGATVTGGPASYTLGNLTGITGTDGTYVLTLTAPGGITDSASNALAVGATDSWIKDAVAPTVTINQAVGQPDPAFVSPINFTVVFSEPVSDFDDPGDLTLSSTGPGSITGVITGGPTTYNVAVSGMTGDGVVTAAVSGNAATDAAGNLSAPSTSTDNSVTFVTCVPPPANMKAWWSGDNTTRDIAGGNDGTFAGTTAYGAGKVDQAFDFNGSSSVSIGSPTPLKLTNSVSVDAWVRPTALPASGQLMGVATKWVQNFSPGPNSDSFGLYVQNNAGTLRIFSVIHLADGSEPSLAGGVLPLNTWSHIASTYDHAAGQFRIYANGVQVASVALIPQGITGQDSPIAIGREQSGQSRFFTGQIDEVEIFDRALTAGEVNTLFTADAGGKCKPSDLRVDKAHVGSFTQGAAASYTVTVSNDGPKPTTGTTTMTDVLPAGLTPGAATGTNWTCNTAVQTVTCTSIDAIASGASFPVITVPVVVAQNSALGVTNIANVSGGGEMDVSDDSDADPTTIIGLAQTPNVTNSATVEDVQTTSGLVITPNATDGAEVTHFKITSITNGTLFLNDGVTQITNGTFITTAQGGAGLKFTPAANFFGNGSFQVEASVSNTDSGLGGGPVTATITVSAIADTPSVTNATTNEDVQTASGLVISRNAADGAEVTHFKITSITNGSLFLNDGTTAVPNGTFITFAQGNAGLKFTPAANLFSPATPFSFQIQASTAGNNGGLGGGVITATITVDPVADTPSVTNSTTSEDTQTTSGLVISRNAADGAEVTHFKITNITNGSLFQNNGTTPIANGDFITFAQGNAGLKFTPNANFFGSGSFDIQASTSNVNAGLGGGVITATITVNAVADTPSVTNATTNEDVQTASGLVISRNAADGAEVTHFKITAITNGTLFLNDGVTAVPNGTFVTFAQGNAGLKFTPAANFFGSGSFQIQASVANNDTGLGGGVITATITVNPVADTPSATNATTNEDTQTTSGLVISRNAADGAEVTHFKITAITNGSLFLNDGTTPVSNGTFLTFAQANAGLKFTPAANFFGTGTFQVQASLSNADAGLGGGVITVSITVNPVADTPSVTNSTTNEDTQTASGLVVSRNAADGAEVTHFKITNITNGSLFQNDGTTPIANNAFITFAQANAGLRFSPAANLFSPTTPFSFQVQASISNADAGLGGSVVTATITVNPVADTPSVTNATTVHGAQTTSGLVISRNVVDSTEVTHFKVTNILNGALFQNNGTTPIPNNTFITFAQGNAGLKFTPNLGFVGTATFQIQASVSGVDAGLGGGVITANITVNKADTTTTVTSSLNPSPLGSPVTFTSTTTINPPGQGTIAGTVNFLDGANPIAGCQNVAIVAAQAQCTTSSLTSGSHVITAQYAGNATFNPSSGTVTQVVDLPPTAAATAPGVVTSGGTTHTVTVTYTDDFAINVASLDSDDIRVTGPNAFNSAVTFVGVNINTNGTPRVATYTFTTPGGTWDIGDNGTYNIVMQANQVVDSANQPVAAGTIGTFVVNIPPVSISGRITQFITGGAGDPGLAGVTVSVTSNNVPVPASVLTDAAGNYTFNGLSHGGNYVVTASGFGKVYDPLSRTYNNVTTNIAGANFAAYDPNAIPRTITVVNTYPAPGDADVVPIVMNSRGTETFVSFSLSYATNPLANNPTAVCGAAAAPGCTVTFNNATPGQIGVTITNPVPFTAGAAEIARITFQTLPTALPSTPVNFTDVPTVKLVKDADNNPLPASYVNGLVVFAQGLEGDVAGRNAGSGALDSSDVVQARRFVTGLDTPVANFNEFQRADTAPSITKGNGIVDATDVIQTRRYAAGLDPTQSAAGPGQAVAGPIAPPAEAASGASREVVLGKANASTGSRVMVPVEMRANGDEMAASFSIRYDQTKLTNPTVELSANAPDGVVLTANTDEPGVIRVLIDSTAAFAPSSREPRQLVNVSFDVAQRAPTGDTTLEITDGVISDARANGLAARYTAGTVSISGPNALSVSISGRVLTAEGAGLRNAAVSITDASGATRTVTTGTFGYYRIEGVTPGREYTLTVNSRRYRFTAQKVTPGDNLADVDFTAQE